MAPTGTPCNLAPHLWLGAARALLVAALVVGLGAPTHPTTAPPPLGPVGASPLAPRTTLVIEVDPGRDGHAGLVAAQQRARQHGPGAMVRIGPGRVELEAPLSFGPADAGTQYVGAGAGLTTLSGGTFVAGPWTAATDPALPRPLNPNVFHTNLWAGSPRLNASLVGDTCPSFGAETPLLQLFFRGTPQWRARWPNRPASAAGGNWTTLRVSAGYGKRFFCYTYNNATAFDEESADRWARVAPADAGRVCFKGLWRYSWRDEWAPMDRCNATNHCCFSPEVVGKSGGQADGGAFFGAGWAGDLDTAGEFTLDPATGGLNLWPLQQAADGVLAPDAPPTALNPFGKPPGPTDLVASVLGTAVTLTRTHGLLLANLTLEHARGDLVAIVNSTNCTLRGLALQNAGGSAVVAAGGAGVRVTACNLTNLGMGGVKFEGGERESLTPAGHQLDNSRVSRYALWKYTYRPAAGLSGVGHAVRHNEVFDAPHQFVSFAGNNHLIELNDVHDVIRMAFDSGAVYADRNPTYRGTVVRHNLFRRLGNASNRGMPIVGATSPIQQAIYVDDFLSQTVVEGNIFCEMQNGFFSHNGRNHTLLNNLFLNVTLPVALSGAFNWGKENATFRGEVAALPYQRPPWSTQYPDLAAIYVNESLRYSHPGLPRFQSILRNAAGNPVPNPNPRWSPNTDGFWYAPGAMLDPRYCQGCVHGWGAPALCRGCFTTLNNTASNTTAGLGLAHPDPCAALNFTLAPDSPLWALGWQRIPEEEIGPVHA